MEEEISCESVKRKLGFDPFNPPEPEMEDPYSVDDTKPSIWAPLNEKELLFVIKLTTGIEFPG